MAGSFFEQPILNDPHEAPRFHHALDKDGQPLESPPIRGRRRSEIFAPVPKPKKTSAKAPTLPLGDGAGQQYAENPIVNEIRAHLERWRAIPNPKDWGVTPTTERLLTYRRAHNFHGPRPFFRQIEAVETLIWLTEVAAGFKNTKGILDLSPYPQPAPWVIWVGAFIRRSTAYLCGFSQAARPMSYALCSISPSSGDVPTDVEIGGAALLTLSL
jgi:hypothetical protein